MPHLGFVGEVEVGEFAAEEDTASYVVLGAYGGREVHGNLDYDGVEDGRKNVEDWEWEY